MSLWEHIAADVAAATGQQSVLKQLGAVSGGCINEAQRVRFGETDYFVKLTSASRVDMFMAEFAGLNELRQCAALHVPAPLCCGHDDHSAWLVMEYLSLGRHGDPVALAEGLASLHHISRDQYGWHRPNTIGATPQDNTWSDDWVAFWQLQRLQFQLDLAARNGVTGRLLSQGEQLLEELPALFEGYVPQASLLHGDLWAGNYAYTQTGEPTLFDPAVYYGDREADLAMTELFGGFGADFYAAYNNAWPLDSGYRTRKTLYNLYHILNHFNMFGGGYGGQAQRMMASLLGELR
ncbi:MAG: fructosamine kinase family protein [Gammaproteobacteria bacterium]|jgi:fructosamine-3-kinase|nr:fructosamine kinase family protein [Gammaproteobacteria bacterium]